MAGQAQRQAAQPPRSQHTPATHGKIEMVSSQR